MVVNSDGPTGCLGIAKALEIERSPGSGCTQALTYRPEISCSVFPTDSANCGLLNSQSQWIIGAFTSWLQSVKQIRRRWWSFVVPPMASQSFSRRLRA